MVENTFTLLAEHQVAVALAAASALAWVTGEYLARRSTWRQGAPRRPSSAIDRGTYPIIGAGLVVGMAATLAAFLTGVGGYLPLAASLVGVGLVAAGLAVRGWALRTLGRFFTMPITLPADQEIVRRGPYRWIRHPAYTGGLLTAVGVALAVGATLGVVVTLAACLAVYVYRIGIEEAALVGRFGDGYREYSRATWRLLPGLY